MVSTLEVAISISNTSIYKALVPTVEQDYPNSAGFIFNLFIIVSVINSVILRTIDAENYRYHFKHF